jgi:hypothetical protein
MPEGTVLSGPPGGYKDPIGEPVTVTNHKVNYGWEYVQHCHLLGHEEMDMMHTLVFAAAPKSPSNLTAALGNSVILNWTDNSAGETNFTIQRARDSGFTVELTSFTIGPNATNFIDANVTPNFTYHYRVFATSVIGDTTVYAAPVVGFPHKTLNSAFSNNVSVTVPVTPVTIVAPDSLWATINTNPRRITLTWRDASDNELRFMVWRSDNGGSYTQIGNVTRSLAQSRAVGGTVTFSNANTALAPLVTGHTYTYYVTAVNAGGSSLPSTNVSITLAVPLAPSGLVGTASRIPGNNIQDRVVLNWTDNSNNENNFQIQRATGTGGAFATIATVSSNVKTFTQTVSRSSDYRYRVRATNALGNSAWSNIILVTTP